MIGEINDTVDKWYSERWRKFTASENYKLLSNNAKGEVFGAGAWTYIKQKVLEMATVYWERPELEEVKSLLHGKMYEYPAFERYVTTTRNTEMVYLGTETPLFIEYEPLKGNSGGSPDAITKQIDFGAEIKCPKNPMYHFDRLKWKDQWDISQNYEQAYIQIQNLMMITGAPEWDFVSFDERMRYKDHQIKIITVKPEKRIQDKLHLRLVMAIQKRNELLQEYIGLQNSN
jgi:hypothetical protein